jgi:hypothetical protein
MPTDPPIFFFLKSSGRNDCRLRRVKAAACKDLGKQNAVQLTLNEKPKFKTTQSTKLRGITSQ